MQTYIKNALFLIVRSYQVFLSPVLPRCCRFYPSCSEYMLTAVGRYGFPKGFFLGLRRILRCHPWNPGGYDPVV
ncbi:MAG: membrane protein insertion efficiency factor YidD [Syntrophaceae bacterium]